ncbi:MAG TPA: anaerobic ribonucleoside-triphosphate reductase activating protein, partial [Rubrivivax sp.]|nr:anaerobic ribonucleoside-triphosphate reductase activating protein [Rubrivivax sp.]
ALLALADELAGAGALNWALQIFRAKGAAGTLPAVAPDYPGTATLHALRERLPAMIVRRG